MKNKDEIKQYKNKKATDLYKILTEKYSRLQDLVFAGKFRKLKDTSQIKKTKKSIARISTIISYKLSNEESVVKAKHE